MSAELAGRTAVVTGASAGIGRAIAWELAQAGADVLLHTRSRREAAEQVAALIRGHGRQSTVLVADLADRNTLDPLLQSAWAWQNKVDIWVNNAGGDVLTGGAARWSFQEKLDYLWRVEVRATTWLARSVGQRMLTAYQGGEPAVILNMGWDQAEQGMGGDAGELFATIKAAVSGFSRSLAQSLAPAVRVNCVAPGWIQTAWGQQASDAWQQRARRESLLERWGQPADVARVARFLVSPAAGFVNGHTVPVNGGFRYGSST